MTANAFSASRMAPSSPRPHSNANSSAPAVPATARFAAPRRTDELVAKSVQICGGPYKGFIGIVKDATDVSCRVELHSTFKTITVERSRVVPIASSSSDGGYGSRTPAAGFAGSAFGKTPLHGSQTPGPGSQSVHGSRTPMHSLQTPMHEGLRTPSHYSNAWDPAVSNTPHAPTTPSTAWNADASDYNVGSVGDADTMFVRLLLLRVLSC